MTTTVGERPLTMADIVALNPDVNALFERLKEDLADARAITAGRNKVQDELREKRAAAQNALWKVQRLALEVSEYDDIAPDGTKVPGPGPAAPHIRRSERLAAEAGYAAADAAYKRDGVGATNKALAAEEVVAAPVAACRKLFGEIIAKGAPRELTRVFVDLKLAKGQLPESVIAPTLAKIADLDQHIANTADIDLPLGIVRDQAVASIDDIVAKGKIGVHIPDRIAPQGVLRRNLDARIDLPRLPGSVEVDVLSMVIALHRDEIVADVTQQLETVWADGRPTMTDGERKAKLAELRAERLELERIICAAVWEARDEGRNVPFPPGMSARAILAI